MSEAYVPTQQPQAGQEPRVPSPDVDPGRPGGAPGASAQGPRPALRLIWRVERRDLFAALRSAPRGRSGPLAVSFLPGSAAEPPRVAFAVGRKVGTAVQRNRLRRRLRALLRERIELGPGAYLVAVGPGAANESFASIGTHLERALEHCKRGTRAGARTGRP
jgi:ribonuclease P protein component